MKVIPIDKFTKSEIELQTLMPDHPHIVQVYEAFKTENVIILVLEYCHHGDLFEFMQKRREEHKGKPMDEATVRNFFLQIFSPVRDLHSLKVAHHDIKLENYLLTHGKMGKLTLKLADFGAAEKLDRSTITTCRKGHISPEKKVYIDTGRPYCAFKSDLYQLGSALHEVAFEMREPRPDGSINPPDRHHPSAELHDLLTRMLILDPARRISMDEVLRHPWVIRDHALYEQVLSKAPPALVPIVMKAKADSSPQPQLKPHPSHPMPLKAEPVGSIKPEIPRLALSTGVSRPTGIENSKPHDGNGKLATKSPRVPSARPTDSPGLPHTTPRQALSARTPAGVSTPRVTPGSATARPVSASARLVTERTTSPHPAKAPPAASTVPSVTNSARMMSPMAAFSPPAYPSPPVYSYSTNYGTAPNYGHTTHPSPGYSAAYSHVVPNQYYSSAAMPAQYTMASPSLYSTREALTSPRYYASAMPASPYGGSYIVTDNSAPHTARAYHRMEDLPHSYASPLTPRSYYI